MLKFYYAPRTCSLAAHIALEESGASYEAIRLNFPKAEQRAAPYLAINPKGRVPSLVSEEGVITETPAILAFIAQSFPDAGLAPLTHPFAFAEIQAFNSYLCSTVHVAHAHRVRGSRWADDEATIEGMKKAVPRSVGSAFELIEETMLKGPWVMGDSYSIADPYLYAVGLWLEDDGVDPSQFPKFMIHRERMLDRPAVQTVLAAVSA